jgi:hypothetical protein
MKTIKESGQLDSEVAKYNARYEIFMKMHPEFRKYNMPKVGKYEEINKKTYLASQRYDWFRKFWREYLDWCK